MMPQRNVFALIVLCLVLSLLLVTGCGKPSLESIEIEPAGATARVGQTLQFRATGRDAKGNALEEITFTWSVEGDSGRIDEQGSFTALQPGVVIITAAAEAKQATASVTVQRQPVARISATTTAPDVAAGEQLKVTVTVRSAADEGIPDVAVTGTAVSEGTGISPSSATTDKAGRTTFTITAATQSGPNRMRFSADDRQISLEVQGVAGAAARMQVVTAAKEIPAGQAANVRVTVLDQHGNPVPKATVRFEPLSKPMRVSPNEAATDASGQAGTRVEVNPKVGLNQLRVSVPGLPSQDLDIKTVAGKPTRVSIQADSSETIAGGAITLTVHVQDAHANPVAAVPIQVSALPVDAKLDATALTTDEKGTAYVTLQTSSTPGNNEVRAVVTGLAPVSRSAVGLPPVSLQVLPQSATVAMQGSHRFRALLSDESGHTVQVTPTWSVVGETGTVDADGMFTARSLGNDLLLATYDDLTAGAQLNVIPGPVASLDVTPREVSLASGVNQRFQLKALNAFGYPLDVTPKWTVTGGVGSIDASGHFTAFKAGSGEVVVTAEQVSARIPVTVSPGQLTAIVLQPDRAILRAGEELQFKVSGHDAAGNSVTIEPTWHLTANLGHLDTSGYFRARHAGEGHIRVKAADQSVTVDVPVKVVPAALARIDVQPQTLTVSAGEAFQFTASGYDAFENRLEVKPQWQLTAEVGSLDRTGKLLARQAGSAKIQATVNELVGEASVVVKPGALSSLTLDPAGLLELAAGDTVSFSVSGQDAYGNIVTLAPEWMQSEPLGTFLSEGQFRAEKVGTTDISVLSGDQIASVRVTISAGQLANIAVSPSEPIVSAGQRMTFIATGYDAYDNEVGIDAGWRVTNSIGDIDTDGTLTARRAQVGEVIATAAGISGSAQVEVVAGALSHLEVTPQRLDLTAGEQAQITVVGYDALGNPISTIRPVWQVTKGMGTVTSNGWLTAAKAGEGRVVAAVDNLAIVVELTVVRGELATIRIEPDSARVASGSQKAFSAKGFDVGGNPIPVEATWEVRGDIGTISADGSFTGVLTGRGKVVASVRSLRTEIEVVVEPGGAATIRVSPESASLVAGAQLRLHSEAFDAAGNRVPTQPTWSVHPDLGTITSQGEFQARHTGSGTIVATIGDVQHKVAVEIEAGPLVAIRLLPAKLVISAGGELQFTATGYDAYGNAIPITPSWSLEGGIGQIDASSGKFRAMTAGSGTIVAMVDTVAGLASVTVEPAAAARLQLEPQRLLVPAGDEVQLTLTAFDAFDNVTSVDATWALTAPLGELTDGGFTAHHAGRGDIVVTAGPLEARARVEVQPGEIVRLEILPPDAQVPSGETVMFRAVGYDAFDNQRDVGATWHLQGNVGQVDAMARFTAGRQGEGRIAARFQTLSSQAQVTVGPGKVQRLIITPARQEVDATTVQQYAAYGLDAGGNKLPVTVNWAIAGSIGRIDQNGNFSANKVGHGDIVGYHATLLQTMQVEVVAGPPALLFLTPQRATIPAGETLQFDVQAFDANQNLIPNPQASWQIVGDIGSIDAVSGVFTAQRKGWGKVRAVMANVEGSADVLVSHGKPDAEHSRMVASRVNILADGKTTADIIVLVRDRYGNPVPQVQVTLISSREDRIDQPLRSNLQGVAVGRIRSTTPGESEINAVVESGRVSNSLRLTFFHKSASG